MDRTAALEQIRAARVARGVSYDDLGKAIGTKDPTYLAAALHGQHRLSADEAKRLAAAVGVPVGSWSWSACTATRCANDVTNCSATASYLRSTVS